MEEHIPTMPAPAPAPEKTVNDPVDPETLATLSEWTSTRTKIALELLELEGRKVNLLAADRRINQAIQEIFASILAERGMDPDTPLSIDDTTGRIEVTDSP